MEHAKKNIILFYVEKNHSKFTYETYSNAVTCVCNIFEAFPD